MNCPASAVKYLTMHPGSQSVLLFFLLLPPSLRLVPNINCAVILRALQTLKQQLEHPHRMTLDSAHANGGYKIR